MSSPTTKHDTVVSPYVEGVLPADHQAELVKIRTCFKAWLLAFSDSRKKIAGARERLGAATQDLSGIYPASWALHIMNIVCRSQSGGTICLYALASIYLPAGPPVVYSVLLACPYRFLHPF